MSQPNPSVLSGRRSSSERIVVESICELDCNFDDTLPLPAEVEREFRDKAGDNLTALAWLTDHGIDSASTDVALIQYGMVWNHEIDRYQFVIYAPDHIGPKHRPELAIPIMEDGIFVDLLLSAMKCRLLVRRAVHRG
jgi:hypothetical protein